MRPMTALLIVTTALAAGAAGAQDAGSPTAKATFVDLEGNESGSATLSQNKGGVLVEVELRGLEPGEHGFHLHQVGQCDPADGFKSAGDHLALEGQEHGFMAAGGPHSGDMPNQFVGSDGVLKAHVLAPAIALQDEATVFDADGTAIVVHAAPDDYSSQPSGNAGDRVACAVIEPG